MAMFCTSSWKGTNPPPTKRPSGCNPPEHGTRPFSRSRPTPSAACSNGLGRLCDHARRHAMGNIEALARAWWRADPAATDRRQAIALVARDAEELHEQTALAQRWI